MVRALQCINVEYPQMKVHQTILNFQMGNNSTCKCRKTLLIVIILRTFSLSSCWTLQDHLSGEVLPKMDNYIPQQNGLSCAIVDTRPTLEELHLGEKSDLQKVMVKLHNLTLSYIIFSFLCRYV